MQFVICQLVGVQHYGAAVHDDYADERLPERAGTSRDERMADTEISLYTQGYCLPDRHGVEDPGHVKSQYHVGVTPRGSQIRVVRCVYVDGVWNQRQSGERIGERYANKEQISSLSFVLLCHEKSYDKNIC